MSKKSKRTSRKRYPTGRQKQPQPKSQRKLASTASASRWWWIGGIAAALLLGAVTLGCAVGPGKPEPPTPTSTEKEPTSMPTNPADRNNM